MDFHNLCDPCSAVKYVEVILQSIVCYFTMLMIVIVDHNYMCFVFHCGFTNNPEFLSCNLCFIFHCDFTNNPEFLSCNLIA